MHPILAKPARILLYLAGWLPILALLDYLLWSSGSAYWLDNVALLAPACLFFAFVCLSPWTICRVRPLRSPTSPCWPPRGRPRHATAAALFTGAVWGMASLLDRTLPTPA